MFCMSRRGQFPVALAIVAFLVVAIPINVSGSGRVALHARTRVVQLLSNNGFERGDLRPWQAAGTPLPRVTLAPRYGGRYAALAGRLGAGPAVTSTLSVRVMIPASTLAASLSLYAWRRCGSAHPRSLLSVTVSQTIGRRVQTLARPLNGCGAGGRWVRVTTNLIRARGHVIVVSAVVRAAAGEAAALALDDVYISASLPVTAATARSTPVPTKPATATATATPTMTATAVVSTTLGPPTMTATPTGVANTCAAPAIVAAYQAIVSSYTATPTPRPTFTPTNTPIVAFTPTIMPTPSLTPRHSNIPTRVVPSTPTSGPTPGYTVTPGPSPTAIPPGAPCHPVVKGVSYPFVSQDGGTLSAATPVVGVSDAYAVGASGSLHVRVDFHLVHDASWTPAEYGAYDAAIQAFCGVHVDVLGLVGPGVVSPLTDPRTWSANNAEQAGGNGDNPFMRQFAARVLDLVGRYHSCVHTWELWNEPNVGAAGATGTYIYPSNFAAMLADTYALVKKAYPDVTLVSGGILSVDGGGHVDPRNSGADYLRQTYDMGLQVMHTWDAVRAQFGGNPLDMVGQHLYLDQGGLVDTQHIIDAYRYMHDAYAAFGDGAKPIYMTEGAWSTGTVSPALQALNLDMLYSMSENPVVPYVARVYWYLLRDGTSPDQAYGLETADGQPKPSFDRFRAY